MISEEAYSHLYVHCPFCESKCHYCDFYSIGQDRSLKSLADDRNRFVEGLRAESATVASQLASRLKSIYLGGGTPSLLSPNMIMTALKPLDLQGRVDDDTEWTIEANPSSLSKQSLKEYRALGINRVSLGVQALRDELLNWLGRIHDGNTALRALDTIFDAGFTNVSVDLMCGIPGQSEADIISALETITAYPVSHLSLYLLTLHKQHRHFSALPDDDIQLAHLLLIDKWLSAYGFEHYEISNFAKHGFRSKHNMSYWLGASYLGIGPSAHSFDQAQAKRSKNYSSLATYVECLSRGDLPIEWTEKLTNAQIELERWMLALRLGDGFPNEWLRTELMQKKVNTFVARGLIERHPARAGVLRLTPLGFALSDEVIGALV